MIERILNGRPEVLEHLPVTLRPSSSANNAINLAQSSIGDSYSLHFVLVPWLHVGAGGATR